MPAVALPYLWEQIVKGRRYTYYRRGGARVKLPNRDTPGFLAAYQAAHTTAERRPDAPSSKHPAGSMGALVALYRASPEWIGLAENSRTDYNKALRPLEEQLADVPVAKVTRQVVFALRDQFATKTTVGPDDKPVIVATPRRANRMVNVLRILLGWAHNRGLVKQNVALRPGRLETGPGYRRWTDADVAVFLASEPPAPLRLALLLGLHTGQRKQDCLAMLWSARSKDAEGAWWLNVVQQKTGAVLAIPEHPDLTAALDAAPRTAETILTRQDGKPWKEDHFNHAFAVAVKDAGLSGLGFHGLRKAASARLAESGATDAEADAILGHADPRMTKHYRKQADQRKLAASAMAKVGG